MPNPQGGVTPPQVPEEITAFLETVELLIQEVDKTVLAYRRGLANTFQTILEGNGNLKDYINVSVMLSLGVLAAWVAVSSNGWAQAVRYTLASIRAAVSTFLDSIGVAIAIAGHRILAYFWPQYRAMFTGIANAAAGVSESLGFGLEFLPVVLLNAQTVLVETAILFGENPEEVRFESLSTLAKYVSDVDTLFHDFARDPGEILAYLQNTILTNSQRKGELGVTKIRRGIDHLSRTISNTADQVFIVEGAVNELIMGLPNDIFGIVQEWWAPIASELETWKTDMFDEIHAQLVEGFEPAAELAEANAEKLDSLAFPGPGAEQSLTAILAAKLSGVFAPVREAFASLNLILDPGGERTFDAIDAELDTFNARVARFADISLGDIVAGFPDAGRGNDVSVPYGDPAIADTTRTGEVSDTEAWFLAMLEGV